MYLDSKPWMEGSKFYKSAYIWTKMAGHKKVHTKHFFPEEEGFYEDTWFDKEPISFELIEVKGLKIGSFFQTNSQHNLRSNILSANAK